MIIDHHCYYYRGIIIIITLIIITLFASDAVLDNVAQLEATVEIKESGPAHGQAPHSVPLHIGARPQVTELFVQ